MATATTTAPTELSLPVLKLLMLIFVSAADQKKRLVTLAIDPEGKVSVLYDGDRGDRVDRPDNPPQRLWSLFDSALWLLREHAQQQGWTRRGLLVRQENALGVVWQVDLHCCPAPASESIKRLLINVEEAMSVLSRPVEVPL